MKRSDLQALGYTEIDGVFHPPERSNGPKLVTPGKPYAKPRRKNTTGHCADLFIKLAKIQCGIDLVAEHRFHPTRRWRFDYASIAYKIAIEVEGGIWTKGRHTRGKGYKGDMEKYNAAVLLGWRVVRVTPVDLMKGSTLQLLRDMANRDSAGS